MEFHYPNGKKFIPSRPEKTIKKQKEKDFTYGKRGMTLEEDLNETNEFYLQSGIAVIHKKPTPVQIVNVDYPKRSAAVIKEAYFKQASTTDYNGVYKGRYIDFEAKETRYKTSFPLNNFHKHQIEHMNQVQKQNGIAFVILRFSTLEEVYLLDGQHLLEFWDRMEDGGRKSMTIAEVQQYGHLISLGFRPRIDYIKIIDKIYDLS